jgi:multiple sugar transport system ATP-binding protein
LTRYDRERGAGRASRAANPGAIMTDVDVRVPPATIPAGLARAPVAIRLEGVQKRFDTQTAVRNLDLEIHDGELLVLLGPSGCGKTTTLNMLAGLEQPTGGRLLFGDRVMNAVPPEERDTAMVFQSIALYPHLDVRENIGFALKTRKTPKDLIRQRVTEVATLLDIDGFLDRRIHQLSGGQRQRVAIAKALVRRPDLFLLDEPFSSLDAELRRQMRSELVRIHREVAVTMVFVTHDQEEAMAIADRIAVMNKGELIQIGSPLDLYRRPRNLWVARFIGAHPINVLAGRLDDAASRVHLFDDGGWPVDLPPELASSWRSQLAVPEIFVGVRPEHLTVMTDGAPEPGQIAGEIYTRQILGTAILYELKVGDRLLRSVLPASQLFEVGQPVRIGFDWNDAFVFDRQTEASLSN